MSTVDKGTRWRRKVQDWIERAGASTTATRWLEPGDDLKATIGGLRLSIECKDHRSYNFGGWLDQAIGNAEGDAIPIVVAHRNGKGTVEDAYVVLSGADFVALLRRLDGPVMW